MHVHIFRPEQGEEAILEMHKRYSPQITAESAPRKSGVVIKELVSSKLLNCDEFLHCPSTLLLKSIMHLHLCDTILLFQPDEVEATESDENLEPLVNQLLLSNIPEPANPPSPGSVSSVPNEHYAKVTFVSKSLPPASIHTARVGITNIPKVATSPMSQSPRQPPISPSSSRFTAWSPQVSVHYCKGRKN